MQQVQKSGSHHTCSKIVLLSFTTVTLFGLRLDLFNGVEGLFYTQIL